MAVLDYYLELLLDNIIFNNLKNIKLIKHEINNFVNTLVNLIKNELVHFNYVIII